MNPKTVSQALAIIYTLLNQFEFIQIQGIAKNLIEPITYVIVLGYWNSNIVLHFCNEKLIILSSIKLHSNDLVEGVIKRIVKDYNYEIQKIAFVKNIATNCITEHSFRNKNLLYSISSSPATNENEVLLSYTLEKRRKIDFLELKKTYDNYIFDIQKHQPKLKIIRLSPNPNNHIRKQKLNEIWSG